MPKTEEHLKKTLKHLVTADHKGGLVAILGVGFIISLPIVLMSTSEEKMHLVQDTAQMRVLEQKLGLRAMTFKERDEISHILKNEVVQPANNSKQDIWIQFVLPEIMKFDPSEYEAKSIAKWVWIHAHAQNLDPSLILALITIESRFDPFATSVVGAQGLMQVMPFWKQELGDAHDDLFDPATNIRYGTAILKHYIKRYHGVKKALAAYNGSKGSAKYPDKVMSQIELYQQH